MLKTDSTKNIYNDLSLLGNRKNNDIASNPEDSQLEFVANPHIGEDYLVRFTCPEFTSLCPVTSQPDFAHIIIDYVPAKWIVESKSLKLYLHSFRDHQAFHEACTVGIAQRIFKTIEPQFLRIYGYWYPRGGIPIDIFFQKGQIPKGVFIPETGVQNYRGRG